MNIIGTSNTAEAAAKIGSILTMPKPKVPKPCPHREMAAATLLGVREGVLLFDNKNSKNGANADRSNNAGENPNLTATPSNEASLRSSTASDPPGAAGGIKNTSATIDIVTTAATAATYVTDVAPDTDHCTIDTDTSNTTRANSVNITNTLPEQEKSQGQLPPMTSQPLPPTNNNYQDHRFVSMSSIGFGIDPSFDGRDATEACVRALNDSMVRSTLRLSTTSRSSPGADTDTTNQQRLHVKLGVPPGLSVDTHRLRHEVLPPVSALTLEIVTGGLSMVPPPASDSHSQSSLAIGPSICSVVACMTLQQLDASSATGSATCTTSSPTNIQVMNSTSVASPREEDTPMMTATSADFVRHATRSSQEEPQVHHVQTQEYHPQVEASPEAVLLASSFSSTPTLPFSRHPHNLPKPHRTNSMEVLAMISEKLANASAADSQANNFKGKGATSKNFPSFYASGPATEALSNAAAAALENTRHSHSLVSFAGTMRQSPPNLNDDAAELDDDEEEDSNNPNSSNYNYQKLPPGLTMKNNRRLFVKHSYRDFSRELPLPDEVCLADVGRTSTPNAAFPLKLHEILSQIEQDGLSHIIGWLPHGRSFRIHQQREFADCILPRYFTITKKSSFLRQLNLYGFNRFSAGPDQGSYYHEKFLRGMKFLTKRMNRQKVNGNRIRSAGNPDEEPSLLSYPICPGVRLDNLPFGGQSG